MCYKRLLAVVLTLLLAFSVSGCGEKNAANNKKAQKVTVKEPTYNSLDEYKKSDEDVTTEKEENKPAETETKSDTNSTASTVEPATNSDPNGISYYANKNTKKFHFANCPSVKRMKQENIYVTNNRDELINAGYSPCANCNP